LRFWTGLALGLAGAYSLFLLLRAEGVFFFGPVVLNGGLVLEYMVWWTAACVMVGLYEESAFRGYVMQIIA
jgi:hypothetical protein